VRAAQVVDDGRLERVLAAVHEAPRSKSALHSICLASPVVTRTDGAGVSWHEDGRRRSLAASDPDAQAVELLQIELIEGPCVEAVSATRPALEADLGSAAARARWPRFAPEATAYGVAAVFAFPLMTRGRAIGALDLYGRRPGDLDDEQIADAVLLAELAALATETYDERSDLGDVGDFLEPPEAWAHTAIVHNASGMVAEQLEIDVDAALLRLRVVAFVAGRPVSTIAADVVNRRMKIEPWSTRE
jgi:hypothetical protein